MTYLLSLASIFIIGFSTPLAAFSQTKETPAPTSSVMPAASPSNPPSGKSPIVTSQDEEQKALARVALAQSELKAAKAHLDSIKDKNYTLTAARVASGLFVLVLILAFFNKRLRALLYS